MVNDRILVTGARGQLGTDLVEILSPRYSVVGVDVDQFDITNPDHVREMIGIHTPNVVLHTAAFTEVDRCEAEPDRAMLVNARAVEYIAHYCRKAGARLIFYSTDYVFDGAQQTPYVESDSPDPKTVYGRSKLEGEGHVKAVLDSYTILRLAWVYGRYGHNFVKTMIRLGQEQLRRRERGEVVEPIRVVNDQIGNPSWTFDIARQTEVFLARPQTGLFHCTAEGECSWYDFAVSIFTELGMPVEVAPCTTAQFPRPAPRPANSSLENAELKRLGGNIMRHWREALAEFLSAQEEGLLHAV